MEMKNAGTFIPAFFATLINKIKPLKKQYLNPI
jgi:hypothetical protein